MQTWAKRGLQTALVTGGLLMLGTGIASADENVNPDSPASPLDLNVTAPISEANNAIGTPFGQLDLPAGQTELSTKPVTKAANEAVKQLDEATPISKSTLGGATAVDGAGAFTPSHNNLKGNKVAGDVVVPIQIVDNAVGVIGDAHVDGTSHDQNWTHSQDVATDGSKSGLAGNAVVFDWALPVQIAGNAGGVAGGSGAVHGGSASQHASELGNIDTDGTGSGLSGNVVAGQFATPVQVTGNAASYLLGNAYSQYDADTAAASGGSIKSAGDGGAGSGNIVGAPIALPVKFNGNAGGVWGADADTVSNSAADAQAGDTRTGSLGIPTYEETSGNNSFLDGNAGAASLSPIANVAGNAVSWIGNASTGNALAGDAGEAQGGSSSSTVDSGGFVKTAGDGSAAGGNVLNPSLALPVEAFGIGAAYIGNSHASHDNTTTANAGNGSYTKGNDALLGGNIANTQTAGAPEVYGIGASHIGNASGQSTEDKVVTAGAYDGTQGDDSTGSGNLVQLPVAMPAEVMGLGGSFIGQGSGSAEETKSVFGGGGGNVKDDNGFLSSNLGTAPLSLPVQVANAGAAVLGQGHGKGATDTTSHAGSDVTASGPGGAAAGNIVEAPVSLPLLAAGSGAALGGIASGENDNITDSKAGGHALTDGQDGAIAGNIVKAPVAGAGTIIGDGIAGAALGHGKGTNDITSAAGGDATTNGDRGGVSGNIIGADALPVGQVFGTAVSAAGVSHGDSTSVTSVANSGDDATSGVEGAISGDILDIPATAIPHVFGDAVAATGVAHGVGDNTLTTVNGGEATTTGDGTSLSGYNLFHSLLVPARVYGVPVELLGTAVADSADATSVDGDTQTADLLGTQGSELGANELPGLPSLPNAGLPGLPGFPVGGERADLPVSAPTAGLPLMGGLPGLSSLGSLSALGGALPGHSTQRADLPTGGLPVHLPVVPAVPVLGGGVPTLPVALPVTPAVPTLPMAIPAVPATPQAAALPVNAKLPVLDGAAPAAQVPAMSGVDSTGFLAKLLGLVKRTK